MPNPTNRNTIARSRPRRRTAALLLVGPMLAAAGCAAEKPVPDVHLPALAWRPAVIEAVPGATLRVGVSLEGEPIAEDLAFRFESSSP